MKSFSGSLKIVLCFFLFVNVYGIKSYGQCTMVNSLTINTGYNPVTNATVGVGQPDPNWTVFAYSNAMITDPAIVGKVALGANALAITPFPAWINNPNSQYISCMAATSFPTPASNNGPLPEYSTTFRRSFRNCMTDSYTFNLNFSDDNFISVVSVDGVQYYTQANANNFAAFANLIFSVTLAAGTHNIDVTLWNSCQVPPIALNYYGLNIFGTISGTQASLVGPVNQPGCSCATQCSDTCYWKVSGNNILNGNNIFGTMSNHDIRVFSGNNQRGVIKSNGYFGWQTASPTALFHINCANLADNVPSNLRFENLTSGRGSGLVVDANGYVFISKTLGGGLTNNCGTLNYLTKTGSPGLLECSQVYDDGNFVGIATTSPFVVNGVTSKLNVNGLTVSNSFYAISDGKFKQDVETIGDATSIINKLRGVTYSWNQKTFPEKNFENNRQAGFIAQEVNAVYPLAVGKDRQDNYVLNYNAFIPLLTQGQQELYNLTNSLKADNEMLRKKVDALQVQLNGLLKSPGASFVNGDVKESRLYQNIPNPFNGGTTIGYFISGMKNMANLIIYDLNGKELNKFVINRAGEGSLQIKSGQFYNGMYLYTLVVDGKEIETKKMIVSGN